METTIADQLSEGGNRNTSFFHTKVSNRKQQNWIQGLEDENELWQEGMDEMEYVATQYFSILLTYFLSAKRDDRASKCHFTYSNGCNGPDVD